MRIFTGAPMPAGADTVFMQEDGALEDAVAILPPGLKRGANARPAGEGSMRAHSPSGRERVLTPQHLALCAGIGHAALAVRRPVRVGLFSTGDELVEPGGALGGGAVYDTNRIMLGALLRRAGAAVTDLGILRDDPAALRASLADCLGDAGAAPHLRRVSTGEADS